MNKTLRNFILFAVAATVAAASVSCEANIKDDVEDDPDEEYVFDSKHNYIKDTEIHFNTSGGMLTLKLEPDMDWSIKNAPDWVVFSEESGKKSPKASVRIAVSSNGSESPREASFIVVYTNKNVLYTVKQESGELIFADAYTLLANGTSATVRVSANVDYEVSTDASWVKATVSKASSAPTKAFSPSSILLTFEPNNGASERKALVMLKSELSATEFVVLQPGTAPAADFTKKFYKKVAVHEFTACWCQYCPLLLVAVEQASQARPGRLVHYAFHPNGSENSGNFAFSGTSAFMKYYSCDGYPSSYLDGRAYQGASSVTTENLKRLNGFIDEAVASYPAHCGFAINSGLAGGKVTADVYVASDKTGEYKLGVVVYEDGLVCQQSDSYDVLKLIGLNASKCVHKNIIRAAGTPVTGETVSLTAGEVKKFSYDIVLPEGKTYMAKNLGLKVYIYRTAEDGPAAVSGLSYKNYSGLQVDNTTQAPLGTCQPFQYE